MAKLTSGIALEMVKRIEGLNTQIFAVYRAANDYDGMNNINLIRDIVKAREEAKDRKFEADGLLASLDIEDDDDSDDDKDA